ncbi:Altered inheritance of mitochondria protein 32 [Balamuthia mandrillaris]
MFKTWSERDKVQGLLLAGSFAIALHIYYTHKKQRQSSQRAEGEKEVVAFQSAAEKEETCECGKTAAEGGCGPFNPSLLATVGLYERHVLICTGQSPDYWPAKISSDTSSFANKLGALVKARKDQIQKKTIVTNCDEAPISSEASSPSEATVDLLVFPERIRYVGVTERDLESIVEDHFVGNKVCERVKHISFEPQHMFLVCCHANRDTRCGREGPLVVDSLQKTLADKGITENQVVVRKSSHLGGHKYAAVVVLYPQGDWYGYVSEENAPKLVELLDVEGNAEVAPELWRGRMGLDKKQQKQEALSFPLRRGEAN